MSTCLVTGAAGFIGSHLCERLLIDGHRVIGIDALLDDYDVRHKRMNLAEARQHPRFSFIVADLWTVNLVPLLRDVDVVYHLAAVAAAGAGGANADSDEHANLAMTRRLLDAARTQTLTAFVAASSWSVYGCGSPMREDGVTCPASPDGRARFAAEQLCLRYAADFGVPALALRYFSVYGPRQRPDMAFARFIDAALDGRPIELAGDGSQTRDFIYVGDAVAATVEAAVRGVPGRLFNVGSGARTSLAQAVALVERATGRTAAVTHGAVPVGDAHDACADVQRAAAELRAAPNVDIGAGLTAQVDAIVQRRSELAVWSRMPVTTPRRCAQTVR